MKKKTKETKIIIYIIQDNKTNNFKTCIYTFNEYRRQKNNSTRIRNLINKYSILRKIKIKLKNYLII